MTTVEKFQLYQQIYNEYTRDNVDFTYKTYDNLKKNVSNGVTLSSIDIIRLNALETSRNVILQAIEEEYIRRVKNLKTWAQVVSNK